MKTRPSFYLLLLIALTTFSKSFGINQSTADKTTQNIPQEKIYVHLNSVNLFSGERLYYKIYCLNKETNSPGNGSKIAYVTIVGNDNTILSKQKIKLINGEGYSDFLIPTSIPSGQYKLVAYTALTLNQDSNKFFIADLGILNPYLPLDDKFTTVIDEVSIPKSLMESTQNKDPFIQIELLKKQYSLRDEVAVKLINTNFKKNGAFSISVRKIDDIIKIQKPNIHQNVSYTIPSNSLKQATKMQPEVLGEVLSGKILPKKEELSVDYQGIVLSIPEENTVLKITNTNKEGHFNFNIDEEYISNTLFLQVLGTDRDKFSIQIDKQEEIDFSFLNFEKLKVNQTNKEDIIQRSINIQIEDSYSSARPDTPILDTINKDIYRAGLITYNLDDFTRFPTLNETMTEIIKHSWFERNDSKDKEYRLKVRGYVELFEYEAPLVVVDGLVIQDHHILYDLNAFQIKEIKLFRDKYYYQGHFFQGIIVIETFDKDFYKENEDIDILSFNHFRPEYRKEYFKQEYNAENTSFDRLPDYRSQLLWQPYLKIQSNEFKFNFYTSDNEGLYEIVIKGFTDDGQAVSVTKQFLVKEKS